MTTWEKIKDWFKRSALWLKLIGAISLIVAVGVCVWIFAAEKNRVSDELVRRLSEATANHYKQLAEVQRLKTEELAKREQIEVAYRATLERISREHAGSVLEVNKAKEAEVKRIIAETQGNPDTMAARVNEVFGLPVVSSRDETP
jgi:hypothetical protein